MKVEVNSKEERRFWQGHGYTTVFGKVYRSQLQSLNGKKYRYKLKIDILTHYGNGKLACVRCGFSDIRALSLDHIDSNGAQERRDFGYQCSHPNFLRLKRENYPSGYQTLCMNCQWIKREENQEFYSDRRGDRRPMSKGGDMN